MDVSKTIFLVRFDIITPSAVRTGGEIKLYDLFSKLPIIIFIPDIGHFLLLHIANQMSLDELFSAHYVTFV